MMNKKGVSLIELVVTVAIVALVIQVVYAVFFAGTISHSISTSKGFAQQDIRLASDFITNELRYVTDISSEDFEFNEYYSLRISNEGTLTKTKHLYQEDDSIETTVIRSIPGKWSSINISNNESGVIDVVFEQTEQIGSREASFDLTTSINTENSPDMLSNVSINLVNGDVLYYRNTKINSLSNSIYLDTSEENEGENLVTVQFYRNDGTGIIHSSITEESETTQSLPSIPERVGYEFSKWNTSSDGSGTSYGSGGATTFTMPSNDTDLYAIWIQTGELQKVTIDNAAGSDGIVTIDGIEPEKNSDDRFIVNKNTGSDIKIKLLNYTSSHSSKVTVTVNNSTIAVEEGGYITFKAVASKGGPGREFDVEITIKTDGHDDELTKKYYFITS